MKGNGLRIGLSREAWQEVTPQQSAKALGSGSLDVLATPSMALMMEQICRDMIDSLLLDSQTSVGTRIHLDHLAPTPIGDRVHLRAEILAIDENIVDFEIEVWDSVDLVGHAFHKRAILDRERFSKRLRSKSASLPNPDLPGG
jgi:fluoroacetyl-CoA thioesterase